MKSEKQRIHLEKLAKSRIGKPSKLKGVKREKFSNEWKKNISKARSGRKFGRNKEYIIVNCEYCGISREVLKSSTKRNRNKFCSKECYSKWLSENRLGEKHPNWMGGITPINNKIRNSVEYKLWRKSVFERDNYTCVWCGEKELVSGKLNADHIKPFALFPELRFAIDNGRTLCENCHKTTETFGGKMFNYKKNNINL
jgi:hypothetical protein